MCVSMAQPFLGDFAETSVMHSGPWSLWFATSDNILVLVNASASLEKKKKPCMTIMMPLCISPL